MRMLLLIASLLVFTGINAAAQPEVKLLQVESYTTSHYGIYAEHRDCIIKVKNLGYAKTITMWAETDKGTWQEFGSSNFLTASADGYEIWKLTAAATEFYQSINPALFGSKFVIKYVVNGTTYWDNNNGQNYTIGKKDGDMLLAGNVLLKSGTAYKGSYNNLTNFYGTVVVKNLGYSKQVKAVYTTDGWKTSSVAYASFEGSHYYPYGGVVTYPTIYGAEVWNFSASMPITTSKIEYCIAYEVNGQTYWDNNSGVNYTIVLP